MIESRQQLCKKIAILYGGFSLERDISIVSGSNAYSLLCEHFDVKLVDVRRDLLWCDQLSDVDFVFNMLHGAYGEDGRVQSILDFLGKQYNTSNHYVSAICFDKYLCYMFLSNCKIHDLYFPKQILIARAQMDSISIDDGKLCYLGMQFQLPAIVKPIDSGSSYGVYAINNIDDWLRCHSEWQYGDRLLLQDFISGIEVTSCVVNGKCIGCMHIDYSCDTVFDYNVKYNNPYNKVNLKGHAIYCRMSLQSEAIYRALGCKGMVRIDYKYNVDQDRLYFLEINTQPGYSAKSIVPKIAEQNGYSQLDILLMQM